MDVLALEQRGDDAVMRRARLHETEGGCDGLVHDFAELAGRLDLALARRGDAFDREQFTADRRPRQPGDSPDLRFVLAHAVLELAHTCEVAEILGRDRDAFDFLLEDLAQALACQPSDLTLQRTDTRLAGVVSDQVAQAFFGELELAILQPMLLDLLGQQVALGNLDLLVLGVARERDDLHPVEQRLRKVQAVRGGHEHDVRKVDVEFEVVILELVVLLRIEHFE